MDPIRLPRSLECKGCFRDASDPARRQEGHPIEARIRVRLTPRAARDEIVGWQGEMLRARVTAPPVAGRANAALEQLLARALGLPKSAVRVVSGARAREKTVAIEGADQEEVAARLRAAGAS